jgi:carboxylesterase
VLPIVAVLGALAAARALYPVAIERRQRRRLPLGPDGIIRGAREITLERTGAPAVLVVHGGGDTPQIVAGLARFLHEHGYAVRVPLLHAHGRDLHALGSASASAWHAQIHEELTALRRGHASVAVAGLSVGGAVAIRVLAERDDVSAAVLLAPYVAVPPLVRRLADTSAWWGWLLPYVSSRGEQSIHDRDAAATTLGHGLVTPAMLRALRDVADAAWDALPRVRTPSLVIQSREDNRIAAEEAERGFARLGSTEKKFVWTNGAGHVITVDFGYQRVFDLTRDWLDGHRPASPA